MGTYMYSCEFRVTVVFLRYTINPVTRLELQIQNLDLSLKLIKSLGVNFLYYDIL